MESSIRSYYYSVLPFEMRDGIYRETKLRYYQATRKLGYGDTILNAFDNYQCIFVHIPKTGGISLKKSLFGYSSPLPHLSVRDYKVIFGQTTYKNYFKFSFVRNPWDKILSAYIYLKMGRCTTRDKEWADMNLGSYKDFESFVKSWVNPKNIHTYVHFVPQYRFICDRNLVPEVDFVGHFENFEKDFKDIQEILGLHSQLQHLNKSNRARNYQDYYTQETREIIAHVYRRDIEIFGYNF